MNNRVVVSGLGLVSCLGHDYQPVIDALKQGCSGVGPMPEWREHGLKSSIAGVIRGFPEKRQKAHLPKKLALGMSEAALYCSVAALDAVSDALWSATELVDLRTGCIVGSGIGSVETVYSAGVRYFAEGVRRVDPHTVLRSMSSSCSASVATLLGILGRNYSISSACATSSHNLGHAFELIRSGVLDRAIAGGGEDLSELIAAAFQAMRLALSTRFNDTPERASRPFDGARDGFVLSGGSGILALESLQSAQSRGARIRAEIIGFAANSDGYDLVHPDPKGTQAAKCMAAAIADAGLEPRHIDYINAHGTGTRAGDLAEARAIESLFGSQIPPVSSTKSMTGHPVGAAGAHELIFCIGMIESGFLAPSINIETLDPELDNLPIVTETKDVYPRTILSNSFGFGGTNSCLVVQRFED